MKILILIKQPVEQHDLNKENLPVKHTITSTQSTLPLCYVSSMHFIRNYCIQGTTVSRENPTDILEGKVNLVKIKKYTKYILFI